MTPADAADATPVRVLFIAASGRSGSTLLERLLATFPDAVAAGELVHLWERGLRDDESCGCGEPFHACPRWQDVGRRAYGGWDTLDVDEAVALRWQVDRQRRIPLMLAPRTTRAWAHDRDRYAARLGALYRAIAASAGTSTVIDSSKHASTAFLLPHVPGVQAHVVHLVRDPRGVANSWTRTVQRPEVTGRTVLMPRYRPEHAAWRWVLQNLEVEALARATPLAVTRVRYEDLVRRPTEELGRLARATGLDTSPVPVHDASVVLDVDHTVSGNPLRFRTGRLELRPDEAWHRELAPPDVRRVTRLTRPLLRRYDYTLTPRRSDDLPHPDEAVRQRGARHA